MSSADAAATTAAKGDIADPAKLKEANAAAEAETKDSEAPKNGSNGTSGDATNGTNGDSAKAADEEPVAGSSKSPSKKDLDVVTQAMGYYAAGKRDLLIQDPASAVASLAQACELLGKHYGETAFECGEPLYYYGRALLDLARMEAGVIDNVMDGEESEEDSKDGDSQDGEEEEDKENGEEEEEAADGEDGKDDSIQGDGAEKEDVAATEKEDEEEPSNLQLAWEMLELAKNILMKQSESLKDTDKDKKSLVDSRICDTYQTLGEVSIENENYQQAIDDLETCLKRRKDMLPEDSRVIAETQYQLGVAQGFNSDFDRAVESLDEAISVLQKRVENLKAEKESKDPAKAKDAFYTREGEIKEIESLIPEIKEKIADTKDMKSEFAKKLAEARLTLTGGSQEEVAGKSDSSVSTISTNLIKKRKKSGEEDGSGDSADAKKAKADSAEASSTNGTAKEESAK